MTTQQSADGNPTNGITETAPIEAKQAAAPISLNVHPIPALSAPMPSSTGGFKPSTLGQGSYLAQLTARLGQSDPVVEQLARDSAFTADGMEVKNQERVKAFVSGPIFPQGHSGSGGGQGANTLRPFVNAPFNSDRLNAGEPVRRELGAPLMRSIGNAWGDRLNTSNWNNLACTTTCQANIDPAGFAQVNHTGRMIADRNTSFQLVRGENREGPLFMMNAGGPNAGAGFSREDGAAGGAVAAASLQALTTNPQSVFPMAPPSGRGVLTARNAYGQNSLIGLPM